MNALSDVIIGLHIRATLLPGRLIDRLHDEERGATQTVEVVALAAVLILVLGGLATQKGKIGNAFGDAVEKVLEAATGTGG